MGSGALGGGGVGPFCSFYFGGRGGGGWSRYSSRGALGFGVPGFRGLGFRVQGLWV